MKNSVTGVIGYIAIVLTVAFLYTASLRGSLGNPTPSQIEFEMEQSGQAFETSQERSRYAIILSLFHEGRFAIDTFASLGTPDIGYINGHYFSFFPPGASVLALPFFVLGTKLGAAQLLTFTVPLYFAIGSMLMIAAYCHKIGLPRRYQLIAALSFAFATNAWGYSVTLYAHVLSSFFILLALYATTFMDDWKGSALFWLSYAAAVFIDFPNLLIFIPLAIAHIPRLLSLEIDTRKTEVILHFQNWVTPFIFVLLMLGYGYYNYVHFGSPTRLSNTIPRVQDLKEEIKAKPESGREAVGALHTRNMLEGFRSFIVSHDRGVFFYTPIALLSMLGLGTHLQLNRKRSLLLLSVPLTCLVLYTMFGDPYGGWAFGSRYILAVQPELMILAVIGLHRFWQTRWARILFSVVFIYSTGVSALAPLTTNVIPPYVEARYLNLASDYRINWQMLQRNELNSFVYNHVLNQSIPGTVYYAIVAGTAIMLGLMCIWAPAPQVQKNKLSVPPITISVNQPVRKRKARP